MWEPHTLVGERFGVPRRRLHRVLEPLGLAVPHEEPEKEDEDDVDEEHREPRRAGAHRVRLALAGDGAVERRNHALGAPVAALLAHVALLQGVVRAVCERTVVSQAAGGRLLVLDDRARPAVVAAVAGEDALAQSSSTKWCRSCRPEAWCEGECPSS